MNKKFNFCPWIFDISIDPETMVQRGALPATQKKEIRSGHNYFFETKTVNYITRKNWHGKKHLQYKETIDVTQKQLLPIWSWEKKPIEGLIEGPKE